MTKEKHFELYIAHREKAKGILKAFMESVEVRERIDLWNEYRTEDKLANKHWGIASMMQTKEDRKFEREHFKAVFGSYHN